MDFQFLSISLKWFFCKKKVHDEIGDYTLKFPCSSDYDFFWRLIKKNKYKGLSTKKNEIIGVFEPGGFSANYGVFKHIWEETLIRFHNKQNKIVVITILILRLIKNSIKVLFRMSKS